MEGIEVTKLVGNVLHSLKSVISFSINLTEKILVLALFGIDKLASTLLIVILLDLASGILYRNYKQYNIPKIENEKLIRKGIILIMIALAGTLDDILKNIGVDFGGILSARNYMVLYFIMSETLHAYSNIERLIKNLGGWAGPEPELIKKVVTKALEKIEFPNTDNTKETKNTEEQKDKETENKQD